MRRLLALLALSAAVASVATAAGAPPPTKTPGVLTVAVSMPAAGFQVGAVRGRDVVLARGFEIDLARELAKRLGLPRVRFVNEPLFSTLVSGRKSNWDVALAEITVTPARATRVDFGVSYMSADQGVLTRKGLLPLPKSIADLRTLQLCAERATTGGQLILDRIKPTRKPLFVDNGDRLSYDLFTKRCDAIVADAPTLAVLRRQAPDRYGTLVGRLATGERFAMAFDKGSPLRASVNTALVNLTSDGTLARLQTRWLGAPMASLPILR